MLQQLIDFFASICADVETILHPDAVTLPNFPRSLQLDSYSCGAKSVYCILQYYDRQCTLDSVKDQLHTDADGTDVSNIKRVFKRYHLNYRTHRQPCLRDLKAAIEG